MRPIVKKVNDVYSEQNPSTYVKTKNKLNTILENKKKFLINLKLTPKIFKNSKLIDLGCGSGQNSLIFDHLGSKCTLIEYDKKSYLNAKKLFKTYARKKFKILNRDIFDINLKDKFDIVVSNGVAHHTENIRKNIKIGCKLLKKDGFFILGVANTAGYFQRNLQRYIVYNISNSKEEIIRNSMLLFSEHINRGIKYGGRSKLEIVYDSYLNPKIEALSTYEVKKIFYENNLDIYSSYNDLKDVMNFLNPNTNQFKAIFESKKRTIHKKEFFLSELQNFSLSNNFNPTINLSKLMKANNLLQSISGAINDISPTRYKINSSNILLNIKKYKNTLPELNNIKIIDLNHNKIFLEELEKILLIIDNKKIENKNKIFKLKKLLKKTQKILRGLNGTGMNYYVGYKIK